MTEDAGSGREGADAALFRPDGDPEGPGWVSWRTGSMSRFASHLGEMRTLRDGNRAIVRIQPHEGLANVANKVHGGAVMTLIDVGMFIGARALGRGAGRAAVTLDCNVQFVGPADLDRPLDAIVEVTRETGRLLFLRGTVEQGDDMIASYVGILRKPTRPAAA